MLALMPSTSALPDLHATTSKMSLAVLSSSPVTYGQSTIPNLLPSTQPAAKRPRLTLSTENIAPIFGKNASSLRMETLSATSPTVRNTFQNTQSPHSKKPSLTLKKPALAPLATNVESKPAANDEIVEITAADKGDATERPYSATSTASTSSTVTTPAEPPYKLPFNTSSILTNGPIPRSRYRRHSFSQTRPMFPAPKKVTFQTSLTEEIRTEKYTLRHSDIEVSAADLDTATVDAVEEEAEAVDADESAIGSEQPWKATSPKTGDKRDSSDEEDSDTCPATPVAGRRKRHRHWRWTLGPREDQQ